MQGQGGIRVVVHRRRRAGPPPPPLPPPPPDHSDHRGKKRNYNGGNLVGPFLLHKVLAVPIEVPNLIV